MFFNELWMRFLCDDNFIIDKAIEFNGWKTTCDKIKKQSFIWISILSKKKKFNPKNIYDKTS